MSADQNLTDTGEEIFQSRLSTPEDDVRFTELVEQANAQASAIVERVNAGLLVLEFSRVIEDHLFVAGSQEGDDYMIFAPSGNIGLSTEANLDHVTWEVLPEQLEDISNTMNEWLA